MTNGLSPVFFLIEPGSSAAAPLDAPKVTEQKYLPFAWQVIIRTDCPAERDMFLCKMYLLELPLPWTANAHRDSSLQKYISTYLLE